MAVSFSAVDAFWNQPIDVILNDLLVTFGWIPIAIVFIWGLIQVWQNYRQGLYVSGLKYVLLAIDIPGMTEQTPKALEFLFSQLYGAYSDLTWKEKWITGKVQAVFSFEIASTEGYIQFFVRTQTRYRDVIEAGIYAHYPDAEISESEDYAKWAPTHFPNGEWEMWGSELKLKKDFIFPIRTYVDFEDRVSGLIQDPLGQILEGMSKMKPGEHFWMQILVQPSGNEWKKTGDKFINKIYGVTEKHKQGMIASGIKGVLEIPSMAVEQMTGASVNGMLFGSGDHAPAEDDMWKAFKLTSLEKEQADGVLRKISKIGHKVKIRMVYVAHKQVYDKNARTAFVKGFLTLYTHLNWNAYGLSGHSTPKDDYFWQRWDYTHRQSSLVKGYKGRSWGIGADPHWLNVEELASLWHFPMVQTKAPGTKRAEARRAEAPVGLPTSYFEEDFPKGPPIPGVTSRPTKQYPLPEPGRFDKGGHDDDHGGGHGGGHAAPAHGAGHATDGHLEEPHGHEAPPSLDDESALVPHPHAPAGADHRSADLAHDHPRVPTSSHRVYDEEEHESGLDATDIGGPPADVKLPGPPPGWKDEAPTPRKPAAPAESSEGPPPNLPV